MALLLGVAACSASTAGLETGAARDPHGTNTTPFTGEWQACQGTTSPEECSRYQLVQRGSRICGTWSYVASGKAYEGKVVAQSSSPTQARRTHVCGRPGSETDTGCDTGWQLVDKPLQLCDGMLGDLPDASGACHADYARTPNAQAALDALAAEPWVRACLSGNAIGDGW
ncbi:hypothetical protein [Luteimonas sp. A482]